MGFLRPLYGTTALLIIAGVIAGMPLGVQIIRSGLMQLGGELEEASRVAGASWWTTYRRIVLRLMAPTLLAVGMITFVGAARNIGNFALLTTSANRPPLDPPARLRRPAKIRGSGGGGLHHHVRLAGRGPARPPARAA